jgi:PTS system mannitol-specific IIC component
MIFGKGTAKTSAPGAALIQFIGGIHEIYFPYVLMNPILVLAVMAGGVSGVFTLNLLHAGLIAPASPGSIIAVLAMTPKGHYFGVLAGVIVAAAVTFIVASFILRTSKQTEQNLSEAADKMQQIKGKKSSVASVFESKANQENLRKTVNKIVFACDAGMGSSAMGASILRKKVKDAGLDIEVTNTSINNLPDDADVVVTQEELTNRAKTKLPTATHISVDNFLSSPKYDELIKKLKDNQ